MINLYSILNVPKGIIFGFFLLISWQVHGQQYIVVEGTVIDSLSKQKLPFCNIGILNKGIGTVSNEKGEFIIKISQSHKNDTLQISSVGYSSYKIPLIRLRNKNLLVSLMPSAKDLNEVMVMETTHLMKKALKKIKVNYQQEPLLMQGFYREFVKVQDKEEYFSYSEGILEMYKAAINNMHDEVRMIKGRKKELPFYFDVNGTICYVPNITNGPNLGILLDFVKDYRSFLHSSEAYWYNYTFEEKTKINDKEIYVLSFKSRGSNTLFEGKLFIEKESLAFVRAEYELSDTGLEAVNRMAKNDNRIKILDRKYVVNYSNFGGFWSFHDANVTNIYEHICQKTKIENKMSFVITQIENKNVKRFPRKEVIDIDESFSQQTMAFDADFWKDFNIIKE